MAMSSSRGVFADGFASDSAPERHSQILKRFNDLKNRDSRNMFFERPFGSDWAENRSFSRSSFDNDSGPFASRSVNKEIPIKVVHQNRSDEEMQHDSSNSAMRDSNGKQHEARIEPRIHHIPIKVEPRDDNVNELSRSSSNSSQKSAASAGSVGSAHSRNSAASNTFSHSSNGTTAGSPNTSKEHVIPITVENEVKPTTKKSGSHLPSVAVKPKTIPPVPGMSQSTRRRNVTPTPPHVTRVTVNQRENEDSDSHAPSEPPKHQQEHSKPDPLELIAGITNEIALLEKQISEFSGEYQDKTYRYLDEMLTRCMLKLDNVEGNGREDVRQARKSGINYVNKCINFLESKVKQLVLASGGEAAVIENTNEDVEMCAEQVAENDTNVESIDSQKASTKSEEMDENISEEKISKNHEASKDHNVSPKAATEEMVVEKNDGNQLTEKEIENENQKSNCIESVLCSNDDNFSHSGEIENAQDEMTQNEPINAAMETNK